MENWFVRCKTARQFFPRSTRASHGYWSSPRGAVNSTRGRVRSPDQHNAREDVIRSQQRRHWDAKFVPRLLFGKIFPDQCRRRLANTRDPILRPCVRSLLHLFVPQIDNRDVCAFLAKAIATARPIPLSPPVISAILFCNLPLPRCFSFSALGRGRILYSRPGCRARFWGG